MYYEAALRLLAHLEKMPAEQVNTIIIISIIAIDTLLAVSCMPSHLKLFA
jgi:hypothetical protein